MKIIKINDKSTISIFDEDIEQHYSEFNSDMLNFNICCELIQSYNENEILYYNVINCLNDTKKEIYSYIFKQNYDKLKLAVYNFLGNLQPLLNSIRKHLNTTQFKNITHNVYDSYKEYQLCYELRNVLQHKGLNLNITIENNVNIKIFIEKKDLLDDVHLTKKTKELLNGYSEHIELLKELNGFYAAECEILKKAYINIFNPDMHNRLLNFHSQNADNQFLYIGDYLRDVDNTGKETIKLSYLHFDKNKILSNISFNENAQKLYT